VEYLNYLLVILALLAVCLLFMLRRPTDARLRSRQAELAERARQRRRHAMAAGENAASAERRKQVLNRELRSVRTPWGWPGSDVRIGNGLNGSNDGPPRQGTTGLLQQWVDRLITEKRTVDDDEYLLRRDASLRAMIEDRFGRSARPTEMAYQPVRAPLLRDPSRPYDQMDNFPSGRTDRIVAKLQREPGKPAEAPRQALARTNVALRDIKTPWGW
jgi:hypothetical protein